MYANWESTPQRITAGDDAVIEFQVTDENDDAVDVTGWTFALYGTDQQLSTNTLSISNSSFSIITAASGIVRVSLARATTLLYPGVTFRCAIWRTNSGSQRELCTGDLKIRRTVRP